VAGRRGEPREVEKIKAAVGWDGGRERGAKRESRGVEGRNGAKERRGDGMYGRLSGGGKLEGHEEQRGKVGTGATARDIGSYW